MKKVIWIVVVVLVVLFISGSCSAYNRMVTAEETVNTTWADVEAQYQRRSDLIPNLVNTVKGYAAHESDVFKAVSDARAKLGGAKTVAETSQANGELSSALSRLLMIAENYPDLKANTNFLQLQDELAGTENRIAVARMDYNGAVQGFNAKIKSFPTVLYAGMFGFDARDYFKADESAKTVPQVQF